MLIEVAAGLYDDQPHIQEGADTFYRGVLRHPRCGGDGVVAGVTGVRPSILNQQQVGIDHKRRGRELQQEHFIRQSEKLFASFVLKAGSECPFIGDETFAYRESPEKFV